MQLSEEARLARNAYMREYRRKNKERVNEHKNRWRKKNPEKVAEYNKRYWQNKVSGENE